MSQPENADIESMLKSWALIEKYYLIHGAYHDDIINHYFPTGTLLSDSPEKYKVQPILDLVSSIIEEDE